MMFIAHTQLKKLSLSVVVKAIVHQWNPFNSVCCDQLNTYVYDASLIQKK